MPGVVGMMLYDPGTGLWVNARVTPSGALYVSGNGGGSSSTVVVSNIVSVLVTGLPLAVSGPVTDAQMRANPIPVTLGGGLTPSSTFVAGSVSIVGTVPVTMSPALTPSSTFVAGTLTAMGPVTNAEMRASPLAVTVQAAATTRGQYALGSCVVSGVVETVLIASGGSTVYHDLTMLLIANSHSTIPARVMVRGALGSAVMLVVNVPPSVTIPMPLTRCLEAPARNMAWTVQKALVGGSCYVSAQAVKIV